MTQTLFNILLGMELTALCTAALAWLLTRLFAKRLNGKWQVFAWSAALLPLVVPLHTLLGAVCVLPQAQSTLSIALPKLYATQSITMAAGPVATGAGTVSIQELAPYLWLIPAATLCAVKLFRYRRFKRRVLRDSELFPLDRAGISPENIPGRVSIRTAKVDSPLVFGLLHPVILLPRRNPGGTSCTYALLHELCHVRSGHLWLKAVAEVVACMHFFNPAAWLVRNRLSAACELACDERIAEGLSQQGRRAYALAILDYMERQGTPPFQQLPMAFVRSTKDAKRRLTNIMKFKKSKKTWAMLCTSLLIAGIIAVAAVAYATTGSTQTKISPTPYSVMRASSGDAALKLDAQAAATQAPVASQAESNAQVVGEWLTAQGIQSGEYDDKTLTMLFEDWLTAQGIQSSEYDDKTLTVLLEEWLIAQGIQSGEYNQETLTALLEKWLVEQGIPSGEYDQELQAVMENLGGNAISKVEIPEGAVAAVYTDAGAVIVLDKQGQVLAVFSLAEYAAGFESEAQATTAPSAKSEEAIAVTPAPSAKSEKAIAVTPAPSAKSQATPAPSAYAEAYDK